MLDEIYHILRYFRPIFSRRRTWLLFCLPVLGFIAYPRIEGSTSFCRFWGVGVAHYHAFLHFFRSCAWSLEQLRLFWATFVLSQNVAICVDGRIVMLGDHTYTPKDGRRMPGVVTLHQESETQTKPSYFRGHCWGALGMLVGSWAAPFCLPLSLALHQGFIHRGEQGDQEHHKQTMGRRLVQMALSFALQHQRPCLLILDAFFSVANVFKLADSLWSMALKTPFLSIIVRAKKNYVAYFPAEPPSSSKPGPQGKYGTGQKSGSRP